MSFRLSPGIDIQEIDNTNIVPAVGTTKGAFVAPFLWGPVLEETIVDSENEMFNIFNGPANETTLLNNTGQAEQWLTAASYLAYTSNLALVRVVGSGAYNATANAVANVLVKNLEHYTANFDSLNDTTGAWAAKYPGSLGNSLKVSICPSTAAYQSNITGNVLFTASSTTISAPVAGTANFQTSLYVGDYVTVGNETVKVVSITSNIAAVVSPAPSTTTWANNTTAVRNWEYYASFNGAPSTSPWVSARGGSNDEVHAVVTDEDGLWTGVAGQILEVYPYLSAAGDAKKPDGKSNYYKNVLNNESAYIWFMNHITGATNWGNASTTSFTVVSFPYTVSLAGGADDNSTSSITAAVRNEGYLLFEDAESTDVSLIFMGNARASEIQNAIDNIALNRKDCVVFFSPESADTLTPQTMDGKADAVVDFVATQVNRNTSYAHADSGHKQMYDRYNDLYRAIPLNGDSAGLYARNDVLRDPWFSAAGLNRGILKNVVKLYFNPRETYRDILYTKSINPIVSTPGDGTYLFGDKTLLTRPSAFDRMNVRRLFIVLEKAISRAAKFQLFEFNDDFTRSQFRNMIEPYLLDVKGRRGITDFRVVCDSTNNTGQVIDRNEFVGDIFVKPARSINFITLRFTAVSTDVAFDEIGA